MGNHKPKHQINLTHPKPETAVLIGLVTNKHEASKVTEHLDELAFLCKTAGGKPIRRYIQQLAIPDSRTYVGSGKLQEIKLFVKDEKIDLVIIDDELGASQIRNLEKELECRILDRTTLILDIFAKNARTAHAKSQVELAQYEYLLPRLTRMWTHLERQRGGIGLRGPGETEIETDRRIIRDKIALLKKKLEAIDRQKQTQRKNRGRLVRVALVGYTNVGKSTLMNLLSKSDVVADNKLFVTLDTTVRKVVLKNLPFLLSDTVGFIRKLPHNLVESFKSTLDEVREADLLIHVVDISHPEFEDQISIVEQTLSEIGASDKPVLLVFNKVDAFTFVAKDADDLGEIRRENLSLEDWEKTYYSKLQGKTIFISAKEQTHYQDFREMLYEEVRAIHITKYPYNDFLF